jgi:histidinol-phosphate aminotransferase
MSSKLEKGGGSFEGIKMLLCENPLPPIEEAIAAAQNRPGGSDRFAAERAQDFRSPDDR